MSATGTIQPATQANLKFAQTGKVTSVDVKVGDDWESMTPLTRADAIAAEADEAPDEAPVAPALG